MAKSVKQLASNLKKKTLKVSNLKKELKAEEAALARITKELSAAKKSKVPAKKSKASSKNASEVRFRQAAPSPAFERRLEPAIDAMETVLDRIMTYRIPLAGMAFCADGRPLRNAR